MTVILMVWCLSCFGTHIPFRIEYLRRERATYISKKLSGLQMKRFTSLAPLIMFKCFWDEMCLKRLELTSIYWIVHKKNLPSSVCCSSGFWWIQLLLLLLWMKIFTNRQLNHFWKPQWKASRVQNVESKWNHTHTFHTESYPYLFRKTFLFVWNEGTHIKMQMIWSLL